MAKTKPADLNYQDFDTSALKDGIAAQFKKYQTAAEASKHERLKFEAMVIEEAQKQKKITPEQTLRFAYFPKVRVAVDTADKPKSSAGPFKL